MHKHSVHDTDTHFIINSITRGIKWEGTKTKLMQGDHCSERYTFEIPRYIEGHDMSACDKVRIHYINIDSKTKAESRDAYEVKDLEVSTEDENIVLFTWEVKDAATKYAGELNFRVSFYCTTDGTVDYKWNTAIFNAISVSDGIDNGEAIVTEYSDILEQWREEIDNLSNEIDKLKENPVVSGSSAKISEVTLLANNWVGDKSPYSQVVSIVGATENSQVDLTPSVEQLAVFYEKDLEFVTENYNGVVTVYAIGQKPQNDYTIQVTLTEVLYD